MTADALLTAHLGRVAIWGLLSVVAGLGLRRGAEDPRRRQAGLQCLLWGLINLAIAAAGVGGTPPSGGFLWLNTGLDVGYAGVGVTLLLCGRRFGARGLEGAGWAVVPQGLVLAGLDLVYLRGLGWP